MRKAPSATEVTINIFARELKISLRIAFRNWKPAKQSGWIASIDARDNNIFRNHSAGSYNHLITNGNGKNGRVRPNTYMVANFSWTPGLRVLRRSTVIEQIVDKHGAMRYEAMVAYSDKLADERVRLNPAALTNYCTFLNLNEGPDEAPIPNRAAV